MGEESQLPRQKRAGKSDYDGGVLIVILHKNFI